MRDAVLTDSSKPIIRTIRAEPAGNFPHPGAPIPVGVPLSPWLNSHARRFLDCLIAGLLLCLLFPLLALLYIVVSCRSDGPAIYKQIRSGFHCKPFTIYKFRTMVNTGPASVTRSHIRDPRLTSEGRFLRRYKLDELPQLINVLLGDMSLVGPRPKLPLHETEFLLCRPGLTGAASIAFAAEEELLQDIPEELLDICHAQIITPHKRRLDREYMRTATFHLDMMLIVSTLLRLGRVHLSPEQLRFASLIREGTDDPMLSMSDRVDFEGMLQQLVCSEANLPKIRPLWKP